MTSVNVTENKYSVSVTEGATTVVTVKAPGPQGVQGATGATGAGISAGDKGALTVAANLTDWTLNDSVVTNAKVASDAAIAGSKISPDFGSQNITTTGNAVFGGNLTVSGTTTTINTQTLDVEDINVTLGKVGSPTDITANQGGISLLGDTTKTFNWLNATDSWTSSEHIALPDNKKLQLGDSQDLQFYHNANGSFISHEATSAKLFIQTNSSAGIEINKGTSENIAKFIPDGAVELYHDNVKRFGTATNGAACFGRLTMHGDIVAADNQGIKLGTGLDLTLFHDGTDSKITNKTGNLLIEAKDAETGIKVIPDGAVELYHDDVLKAQTSSDGFDIPADSAKLKIGASGDLVFFHDGSNSHIKNNTGDLVVSDTNHVYIRGYTSDKSVGLFFNGVKKAETTSSGVTVSGNLFVSTDGNTSFSLLDTGHGLPASEIKLSNGGRDLNIVAPKDIRLFPQSGELGLVIEANGQVELYHDNVKKAETSADGFDLPDNSKLQLGDSQDLQIFHDGSQSVILDNGTGQLRISGENTIALTNAAGTESYARFVANDTAQLFHDNVVRLSTTGIGVTVSGKITSTGDIIINNDYPVLAFLDTNNDSDYRLTNANGNFLLFDISNAATRFTVTNAGLLKVHGNVEPEADNTRALGSSSKRFTTLHSAALNTGDINMSNLNDNGNEVDGSKGSWTLQEGSNDLFLINRVSGKKYKFNLTEIS